MPQSTRKPRPGDAIRILAVKYEARAGDIGVLGGIVRDLNPEDEELICFSFRAYHDPDNKPEYVNPSGGPAWYVTAGKLIPTNETVSLRFWRFKGGIQRAGNDEEYLLEVPVWNYLP